VKLENLVILGLSLALWGMWWKRNGRKVKQLLKGWQARLPRHWHAKSREACPHCQAKAQVTVKRLQSEGGAVCPVSGSVIVSPPLIEL